MSNAMLKIFVRVIEKRIDEGENLEDILNDYPKLTEAEKDKIREKINKQKK